MQAERREVRRPALRHLLDGIARRRRAAHGVGPLEDGTAPDDTAAQVLRIDQLHAAGLRPPGEALTAHRAAGRGVLAASAAFMTPFSHKANLLVMGAGGYRATDYVRVGTPLTIVILILLALLVPFFFPFN